MTSSTGWPYCQQITSSQCSDLTGIAEWSTHHHCLVPKLLVVIVDLCYALNTCHISTSAQTAKFTFRTRKIGRDGKSSASRWQIAEGTTLEYNKYICGMWSIFVGLLHCTFRTFTECLIHMKNQSYYVSAYSRKSIEQCCDHPYVCLMQTAQQWCILGVWLFQNTNRKPYAGCQTHWSPWLEVAKTATKLLPVAPCQKHSLHHCWDLQQQHVHIKLPLTRAISFCHHPGNILFFKFLFH